MSIVNNLLTGFSNNLPGLKDYQHASRLYLDNNYRLAPKNKFLFHVVFSLNRNIPADLGGLPYPTNSNKELGLLVKTCELPKFNLGYEEKIQYNKKAYVATRIQYQPINMVFHDDSADTVTAFWKNYYAYNYADITANSYENQAANPNRDSMYFSETGLYNTQYGMDTARVRGEPFLTGIQIFSLHQKQFTSYTLINPVISAFSHDNHDQTDGAGLMTHSMTVMYEAVIYNTGKISVGNKPDGFAELHYDLEPSPLTAKGTASLLGPGGIFNQGINVLDDIKSGNFIGAAVASIAAYQDSKKISAASIKEELGGGIKSAVTEIKQIVSPSSNPVANFTISTGVATTAATTAAAKSLIDSGTTANNAVINNPTTNTSAYLSPSESLQLISTNTPALNQVASFIYYQQIGSRNGLSIAQSNANYAALPAAAQTQYHNQAYSSITNLVTQGYIQINRSTNNVTTSTEINRL